MAKQFDPYRDWLGLAAASAQPSYYELLGISSQEQDPERIKAAAQETLARLSGVDPGANRRIHQELQARVRRAHQTLADPSRRAAYDERLKRRRLSTVDPMAPVVFEDARPFAEPAGPAGPGAGEEDEFPDPVLPPAAITEETADPMAPVVFPGLEDPAGHKMAPAARGDSAEPRSPGGIDFPLEAPAVLSSTRRGPAAGRAAQRQQTSRYTPLLVALVLTSLVLLFALVYILVQEDEVQMQVVTPPKPVPQQPAAEPSSSKAIRDALVIEQAEEQPILEAANGNKTSDNSVPLLGDEAGDGQAPSGVDAPEPPKPDRPGPELMPTAAELAELEEALRAAREAISDRDWQGAATQLSRANALPQRAEDRAKVARLQQLADLVRQFYQALDTALENLQPGETITVGTSTSVRIVEVSSELLVIQLLGMNRRYPRDELPAGLALAIARQSLPADAPQTKVIEGAYLATRTRADEEDLAQVRSWWESAAAADPSVQALIPVLDDEY